MADDTPNPPMPETAAPGATADVAATPPGDKPPSADVRRKRPDYRGEELDPERGPGLGCFWFQAAVLAFFIVIIPVGLELNWPYELLAILLFVVIGLLLLTGQTVIFLLRLVAADRRAQGRRRPLASTTRTVGEMEDAADAPAEPALHPDAADADPMPPVPSEAADAEPVPPEGAMSAPADPPDADPAPLAPTDPPDADPAPLDADPAPLADALDPEPESSDGASGREEDQPAEEPGPGVRQ